MYDKPDRRFQIGKAKQVEASLLMADSTNGFCDGMAARTPGYSLKGSLNLDSSSFWSLVKTMLQDPLDDQEQCGGMSKAGTIEKFLRAFGC